jgi:hypothetical protein
MGSQSWRIAGSILASVVLWGCRDVPTAFQTGKPVTSIAAASAAADPIPSGERVLGQSVLEPVYDAEQAGVIGFVSTPLHAPLKANPRAWSPFYVPVYPVGSTVGAVVCRHIPVDNCPDHGPGVAGAAAAIMPAVYGGGVIGHDHLMDFPGGADFNVAWEPILVLFTSKAAANEHLLTDVQIEAAVARGDAIEVPVPELTFHCAAVAAAVWARATPLP